MKTEKAFKTKFYHKNTYQSKVGGKITVLGYDERTEKYKLHQENHNITYYLSKNDFLKRVKLWS